MKGLFFVKRAAVLLMVMLALALPAQAATVVIEPSSLSVSAGFADNEALFEGYAMRELYGAGVMLLGETARAQLSEPMQNLYDVLKPEIEEIAAGERASVVFTYEMDGLEQLGFTVRAETAEELERAIFAEFGAGLSELVNMIEALLADCPYDMYWYDKLTPVDASGLYMIEDSSDGSYMLVNEEKERYFTIYLSVAKPLRAEEGNKYMADLDKTSLMKRVKSDVETVISGAQSLSDAGKAVYYAKQIMDRVSYDFDAVAGSSEENYANDNSPWNIINVFDGDPDTNVVCEGYSKAYKYLFDMTDWQNEDTACYAVTGGMGSFGEAGGPHMWNIITLDGSHYIHADVTNSDEGVVGQDGWLLLVNPTSGSAEDGYLFGSEETGIFYTYDDTTKKLWGDSGVLELTPESCPHSSCMPYAMNDWVYLLICETCGMQSSDKAQIGGIAQEESLLPDKPVSSPTLILEGMDDSRIDLIVIDLPADERNRMSFEITLINAEDSTLVQIPENTRLYLPFPPGMDYEQCQAYDFAVCHQVNEAKEEWHYSAEGSVVLTQKGLLISVDSLSPFHIWWEEKAPQQEVENLPETGDDSRIALWAALLVLAGASILTFKRKTA